MRKISLLLLTALSMGTSYDTQAQVQDDYVTIGNRLYEARRFRFGAYIAPTVGWMKPTADKSKDGKYANESGGSSAGFTYGMMAEYWFAPNYALVSGLQMNMAKGNIISTYTGAADPNSVTKADMSYKLNYIEIPIALKMTTDPIENFRFFGQLGFSLGFNVTKKIDYDINYINADGINQTARGENEVLAGTLATSPVLGSMNIGVGAEYPINNKLAAYFGIFFNNGFLPDATNPTKYKIGNVPSFQDGNTRVNNFAFRLGLFF